MILARLLIIFWMTITSIQDSTRLPVKKPVTRQAETVQKIDSISVGYDRLIERIDSINNKR